MERQQYQHGQHQDLLYGDRNGFMYDHRFEDNFQAADQKPILNTDDQDSMTNFFDNPDQASLFGYTFTHEDAAEDSTPAAGSAPQPWNYGNSNNGANHASNHAGGQSMGYAPHAEGHANGISSQVGPNGDWRRRTQQSMMSNEDFSAASFLQGLKAQQLMDGSHPMDGNNFVDNNWDGNFPLPAGPPGSMPPQFQPPSIAGNQPGLSSYAAQDMQQMPWRSHLAHLQQPQQQQHQQQQHHPQNHTQQQQQQQQQTNARVRHLSLDTTPQFAPPAPARGDGSQSAVLPEGKSRPAPVRFGSDVSFGAQGYSGPGISASMKQREKSGNLLGLPLAQHAAKHGRANAPGGRLGQESEQQRPTPNSTNLPPVSAARAGQTGNESSWSGMPRSGAPNLDGFFVEPQPRKRRKSRHEHEDDGEYIPPAQEADIDNITPKRGAKASKSATSDDEKQANKASIKRPKPAHTGTGMASDESMSPSGGGDDDDGQDHADGKKRSRSSKKARENLSESQKRQNHIQSEKKRRDVINNGYGELSRLVPYLANGKSGLSRSESLQEIASYLEVLVTGTAEVMNLLGLSSLDDFVPTATSRNEDF